MAKNVFFNNGSNKSLKEMYININGVNRKIVKGYIGIGGVNKVFWDKTLEVGHYWLIDASGTKEYKSNGTLVSSSSNNTTWNCPVSGNYSIELHAQGGTGGSGDGYSQVAMKRAAAAGGGGGGGSGVLFSSVSLTQQTYSISISASRTTFGTYYVDKGYNGGNGTAPGSAGYGGQPGSYYPTSSGKQLAYQGNSGTYQNSVLSSWASATGGNGGSGGSTIGNYGNGGKGGDATQSSGQSGQSGQPGAIIIRKVA